MGGAQPMQTQGTVGKGKREEYRWNTKGTELDQAAGSSTHNSFIKRAAAHCVGIL